MSPARVGGRFVSGGPPTCHPNKTIKAHGLCVTCYDRVRRETNPRAKALRVALDKRRRESGKTNSINWKCRMKRRFGLSLEDYAILSEAQGHACAICRKRADQQGRKKKLAVDHCHKTFKIRGLLCDSCNRGIGLLKDDPAMLRAAIKYLEEGPL